MREIEDVDASSSSLARSALLTAASLALAGSCLGVSGIVKGTVSGGEIAVVISGGLFGFGFLATPFIYRKARVQTMAVISTTFYTIYLCAGILVSLLGRGNHQNLFIYLFWFFALLMLNKMINAPAAGRFLDKVILIAPLLTVGCLFPRLILLFTINSINQVVAFCLSYICFGLMLNAITGYREAYIVERERAESLRIEAEVLESISDCFISLDSEFRLVYLNDAACSEFAIDRAAALKHSISSTLPAFFSSSMIAELRTAYGLLSGTVFEAQDVKGQWYEMRCFPQRGRMSVYFRNITDHKAADVRIHNLAFHDVLTGLPNRTLLRERLAIALAAESRQGNNGALLLIDLDDFKTLNDTSGHDVGDLLLKDVAMRLSSCLRKGDTLARFGGDEFVVLLEGLGGDADAAIAQAKSVGEAVLQACRAAYQLQSYEYEGTASIGAALFDGKDSTVDDLLKRADLAMYRAKSEGRNNVRFFDPAMESSAAARVALLADLKRAMQNHEFELHYQPQLDRERRVTGCEALLRWRHPQRGMVPPNEFIPLAESAGLIVELGQWVLDTACLQLAVWAKAPETEGLTISVNVSIRQFLDSCYLQTVEQILIKSGANPHRLKLEITESFMVEKVGGTIAKMTALKALGIGFSMDDFGTGYSSLSQLKRLPLDQLKIDQSFVRDVQASLTDTAIVRAIIALAKSLNLSIIAEGVETEAQREFLEELGCYAYQGYLFGPAFPIAVFEEFVQRTSREKQKNAA
jgi:diguanylate cyclase (GGDEF)-like protein